MCGRIRFFRFSFKQLLLLLVVLALLLSILVPEFRKEQYRKRLAIESNRIQRADSGLREAIGKCDVKAARKALEAGARANGPWGGPQFFSWLRTAINDGQPEMVKLLLEYGADVDRKERIDSVIPSGPALFGVVECGQTTEVRKELIRLLVRHGADLRVKIAGMDLMDACVYRADAEMAALLKEMGMVYGPREMVAFNQLEQIRSVVKRDPDVLRERVKPFYACRQGQAPTLLGIALSRSYKELALFLIGEGAPLNTREGQGQTLLHLAARGGEPELISLLVARGLDVNAKDEYKDTPLTDGIEVMRREVVVALVEAGADVNAHRADGKTAVEEAETNNRWDVVEILTAAGGAK